MMSMYYTAAKGLLMSLFLPPETMLGSLVCAAAGSIVGGLCCSQKSCGSLWSVLSLTVTVKEAFFFFFFAVVSVTVHSQLKVRDIEEIYDNLSLPAPTLQKRNSLDYKQKKRSLLKLWWGCSGVLPHSWWILVRVVMKKN